MRHRTCPCPYFSPDTQGGAPSVGQQGVHPSGRCQQPLLAFPSAPSHVQGNTGSASGGAEVEGCSALLPRERNLVLPYWLQAGAELQCEEWKWKQSWHSPNLAKGLPLTCDRHFPPRGGFKAEPIGQAVVMCSPAEEPVTDSGQGSESRGGARMRGHKTGAAGWGWGGQKNCHVLSHCAQQVTASVMKWAGEEQPLKAPPPAMVRGLVPVGAEGMGAWLGVQVLSETTAEFF